MNSLMNYGSDGDTSNDFDETKVSNIVHKSTVSARRANDAIYDPVPMDMSEESNSNSSDDSGSERSDDRSKISTISNPETSIRNTSEQRLKDYEDHSNSHDDHKQDKSDGSKVNKNEKSRKHYSDKKSDDKRYTNDYKDSKNSKRPKDDDRKSRIEAKKSWKDQRRSREIDKKKDKHGKEDKTCEKNERDHHRDDRNDRDRRDDRDRRKDRDRNRDKERCGDRSRDRDRDRRNLKDEKFRDYHKDEKRAREKDRTKSRSRSRDRGSSHRSFNYREERHKTKLAQLEKLGIEIKLSDGDSQANSPKKNFYNPLATATQGKYAEQIQKRKLLWANKKQADNTAASALTANTWVGTTFTHDQDGKVTAKFKRLMGIKEDLPITPTVGTKPDILKKQEEMFNNMEQQYEVARATTHTQRGVGLGYASGSFPFSR